MESAKLNIDELTSLIFYGLKENNIDIKNINSNEIKSILDDYLNLCVFFQKNYVIGELDTFKRAACLLVAINRGRLSRDKRVNASIALDVAYKMCEKPYWNIGEKYDIPQKLEEVDFKKVFENNMYVFDASKDMLIDSLVFENGMPINYNLNLELLYQVALQLKHKSSIQHVDCQEKLDDEDSKQLLYEETKEIKKKNKFLDLFRKRNIK